MFSRLNDWLLGQGSHGDGALDEIFPSMEGQCSSVSDGGNRADTMPSGSVFDKIQGDRLVSSKSQAECGDTKEDMDSNNKLKAVNFQLALYIAMAQAGLLLLILTLYGVGLLLKDFWKPIQWAVLCSITLREIQGTLVRFWQAPLKQGLLQTLLAVPLAICRATVGTSRDAQSGFMWIAGRLQQEPITVGFPKLFQWLVTFALLTLGYDWLGAYSLASAMFAGLMGYAALSSLGFFEDDPPEPASSSTSSQLKKNRRQKSTLGRLLRWTVSPLVALNRHSTRFLAVRLPTMVAMGLIVLMILGSLTGVVLFSYKVGLEAKDAVVAVKDHVQRNNYTEIIGLQQWLENSNMPELIEGHASKIYETICHQVDMFGIQYNLTELTNAGKEYVTSFARGQASDPSRRMSSVVSKSSHPVMIRLHNARVSFKDRDFSGIYSELEAAVSLLLDQLQLKPEDVKDRMKQMSETGANIGKRMFSGGSILVSTGTSLMLAVASSIASGAAGLFNFFTQAAVFISLLYYLITTQNGGVMEQVVGMVPLSASTRNRCAAVLNRAVSSVLLATAKSVFFQGAFTWLLFRFFKVHFLYLSTVLSITIAVLPVLPYWLASLPAAGELAVQGNYVEAIVLMLLHLLVVELGNKAIHNEIPGHNEYLAGLSIAGGMALFSPALEGAIMGPLLMTVLMALKNLYSEFVLSRAPDHRSEPVQVGEQRERS